MIRFLKRRRGFTCDEVMNVLQNYLDGEVDLATARKVAVHLEACVDCDTESLVYRRIKASLAHGDHQPVDPSIMSSLERFSERVASGEIE